MTPFTVKDKKSGESIAVPCGKCPNCYKRRVSAWSFRLLQEDKISLSSLFVTLTYDTDNVPITSNGFMSINKRDVQLFFKRLRKLNSKNNPNSRIRYYAVGEYGGHTFRPHYHVLLFNCSVELIEKAWGLGQIHYGNVTGASVGYCLKYMAKQSRIPMHKNDDRLKEFGLMSKGLGANYMTDKMIAWHLSDVADRMYCNLTDGKKITMPRYYKDKIYSDQDRKIAAFFTRKKMLEQQIENEKIPDYYIQKFYSDEAAFRRMKINSTINQKV